MFSTKFALRGFRVLVLPYFLSDLECVERVYFDQTKILKNRIKLEKFSEKIRFNRQILYIKNLIKTDLEIFFKKMTSKINLAENFQ